MKKILLPIIISFLLIGCFSKTPITIKEIEISNLEAGKCYFTKMINQDETDNKVIEKPFILEIIKPKYEKIDSILLISKIKTELEKHGYFRYRTKKPYYKIVFRDSDLGRFNTIENPNSFIYCKVEVPGEWATIRKEDIINDRLKITKFNLIENTRIIKKFIQGEPKNLKTNQKYFKSGIWSQPKEVAAGSHESKNGIQLVREIQEKLIGRGYTLEVNNILDEKTKKAIFDFQRKNNLKEGKIDIETLKKLGIRGY